MARNTTLNEIGSMLSHAATSIGSVEQKVGNIEHTMATKDDVRAIILAEVPPIVRKQTQDIRVELTSMRCELRELKEKADNSAGLTKEIDHALERIAAIEKHLGIKKKIPA